MLLYRTLILCKSFKYQLNWKRLGKAENISNKLKAETAEIIK